jgi:hypothetical protein
MGNLLGIRTDCRRLRDALEGSATGIALPPALAKHLSVCADCRAAADEFFASRALLAAVPRQRHEPSPWFAVRVISAIAARQAEFRRTVDVWTVVPRLAARLTWASALALLLAGTWLYERPQSAPPRASDEGLFDSAPADGAPQVDVPVSFPEND